MAALLHANAQRQGMSLGLKFAILVSLEQSPVQLACLCGRDGQCACAGWSIHAT